MQVEDMSEAEIFALGNPIMDNLMDASTAINHERHIRDFTERLKRIVTKEHLQRICEDYQREKGYFAAREPVASFKRPGAVAIIWKQRFTKAPGEFVAEMTASQLKTARTDIARLCQTSPATDIYRYVCGR